MLAMEEFEKRGTGPTRQLILHDYVAEVTDGSRCARCETPLKDSYLVSVSGERGTHRLCPRCHAWAKTAYGNQYTSQIQADGGAGR
jgi:hypothetical protein